MLHIYTLCYRLDLMLPPSALLCSSHGDLPLSLHRSLIPLFFLTTHLFFYLAYTLMISCNYVKSSIPKWEKRIFVLLRLAPFAPNKSIFPQMITPFFFRADRSSYMCASCIFLTHSCIVEHLELLAYIAIVNSAALYMDAQASLGCADLDDFGWTPKDRIGQSYDKCIFMRFLRNLNTGFHRRGIGLHFHQLHISLQFLSLVDFLMTDIFSGISWNLNVVLICISSIVLKFEYSLLYLLNVCSLLFLYCSFHYCLYWLDIFFLLPRFHVLTCMVYNYVMNT